MTRNRAHWPSTTHAWAADVDREHLAQIRANAAHYSPGGLLHLVCEVMAYADEEAAAQGRPGRCVVTRHDDGSVSIDDDGRGTDTRVDDEGNAVRKPVMATKDLRLLEAHPAVLLPDGHPRRGMSVVAALSEWLVHTNRRRDGAWSQRYEHGIPVSDLTPLDRSARTGTVVRFRPDPALVSPPTVSAEAVRDVAAFVHLEVHVLDDVRAV